MTNMQAALGVAQLERLDEFVVRKRRMGTRYAELLGEINCLQMPLAHTSFAENIYWVFGLVISDGLDLTAEEAMAQLASKGIGTRPFFYPMHQQPVLRRMGFFQDKSFPVAERLYRKGFYIPSGMALTDQQMEVVIKAVKEVFA